MELANLDELRHAVIVKQLELRSAIEELVKETNQPFTPWAPHLSEELVANCRVLPSRYHILDLMPKNAVCVEVGTQAGHFAKSIMTQTKPLEFHVIDIDLSVFERAALETEIASGVIHLHEGDSSKIMESFADEKFDWIYIDADHSYEGFVKDLEVSARKVKPHGFIACNDYTVWSPGEVFGYGILLGVHEFCVKNHWEFVYIGLHGQGYHDVCIRKRA
jgi:hypothetical protein